MLAKVCACLSAPISCDFVPPYRITSSLRCERACVASIAATDGGAGITPISQERCVRHAPSGTRPRGQLGVLPGPPAGHPPGAIGPEVKRPTATWRGVRKMTREQCSFCSPARHRRPRTHNGSNAPDRLSQPFQANPAVHCRRSAGPPQRSTSCARCLRVVLPRGSSHRRCERMPSIQDRRSAQPDQRTAWACRCGPLAGERWRRPQPSPAFHFAVALSWRRCTARRCCWLGAGGIA